MRQIVHHSEFLPGFSIGPPQLVEGFADTLPSAWNDVGNFSGQDLVNHVFVVDFLQHFRISKRVVTSEGIVMACLYGENIVRLVQDPTEFFIAEDDMLVSKTVWQKVRLAGL